MTKRKQAAKKLQDFAAISLSFEWFGTLKALDRGQNAEAANVFEADSKVFVGKKKIIDTSHDNIRKLTAIRNEARHRFYNSSLPFPMDGVRLFRKDSIDQTIEYFEAKQVALKEAAIELADVYKGLKREAKDRLGKLYNPADYPQDIASQFSMSWQFHSVHPPDYLKELNPALYEEQVAQVKARFEQAVVMAEQAFAKEFADLVDSLKNNLGKDEEGNYRKFHASSVNNLKEFFDKFKTLNVRSNPDLDALIDSAKQLVGGINTVTIKENTSLRNSLAGSLGQIEKQLCDMVEIAPRRTINRKAKWKETMPA